MPDGAWAEADLLSLAAGVEKPSEHPLAAAIITAARERGLAIPGSADFQSITGKGVIGTVERQSMAFGNRMLMQDLGVACDGQEARAEALRQDGATTVLVGIDGRFAGVIAVATPSNPQHPRRSTGCACMAFAS